MKTFCLLSIAANLALAGLIRAEPPATKVLLEMSGNIAAELQPTSDQVTTARSDAGLTVTIQPGKEGYPGVRIVPPGGHWDLSAFGHVEAKLVNTGTKNLGVALRVDNAGNWQDNPWNAEQVYLKPGESKTLKTIFGHSYGYKPGYPLKPAEVAGILMFVFKSDSAQSFRLESLVAAGPAGEKPPVDPKSIRIKPKNGNLLDTATQIESKGGVQGSLEGAALKTVFPPATGEQSVTLKPAIGRWDLRDATEVRVKVKNTGTTPVTPHVQVSSDSGATASVATDAPLAPGAAQEIVVSFIPAVGWQIPPNSSSHPSWDPVSGTGTKFNSDAAGAIKISAKSDGAATLLVESIIADAPVAELPAWLGKRPPVDGDWVQTFADEFDGTAIDQTKWNITGPNYCDKRSHWSMAIVIVGGGVMKLHYEKKTGHHNDDPKEKETAYTGGYLDTYGKWVQRYGYFEARMKLPTVPGMWPAFWMMPDRGVAADPQWKRADTGNGGMEFDIMEHLTRWGPHRYNIAMHWDGYQKAHKQAGSQCIYAQDDKDGFITSGLLWLPGQAVYYCNGKEVLRWEDPRIATVPANLILYMVTGGWDNNALDDTQLPVDFIFDYVRIWQRKDLASDVDGFQSVAKPAAK